MTTTQPSAASPDSAALVFETGQKLAGCYVLRQAVETVGGEVVWFAHDEVLGKNVSLHFIPEAVRGEARAMDALRAEIKRARQLIHPHILRVYDLIEESDWAAISMDHFEGESLATLLRRKDGDVYEPAEVKGWLGILCQTVEDAHKIQLVHRDLSPANVLLQGGANVTVARFGISRLIKDALARTRGIGEPEPGVAYMSPQQLDGERPTPADDVYSLGVLLYEALTGEPPFSGKDVVPQIRRKVPPSIAERRVELKHAAGSIPAAWEKAIASCLQKLPEERPKSMSDLAARLSLERKGAETLVAEKPSTITVPATSVRREQSTTPAPLLSNEQPPTPASLPQKSSSPPPTQQAATTAVPMITADQPPAPTVTQPEKELAATAEKRPDNVPSRRWADRVAERRSSAHAAPPVPERAVRQTPLAKEVDVTPELEDVAPNTFASFEPPRRGSFPLTWVAAAALLIAVGVYGMFFSGVDRVEDAATDGPLSGSTDVPSDLTVVANTDSSTGMTPEPAALPDVDQPSAAVDPVSPAEQGSSASAPVILAAAKPPRGQERAGSPQKKNAAEQRETPAQAGDAAPATPAETPSAESGDGSLASKAAALESARQAAEAAEKEQQALTKQKEQADAAVAEAQKAFDAKSKAAAPILKAAEEAVAARKAREDEMRDAEAAAQQAQQMAAEKARAAEEAKKALAAFEKENKDKLSAPQKAEADLKALQSALEEKRKIAEQTTEAAAAVAARRQANLAAMKRTEEELAAARMMAQKASEEAAARQAAERRKMVETEIAEARRAFEERMKQLESMLKGSETGVTAAPAPAVPAKQPEVTPPAPAPTPEPKIESAPPVATPKPATSAPAPAETPLAVSPKPAPAEPTTLVMKTDPSKPPATPTPAEKKGAGAQAGFENSLGMKFAAVETTLFSIWQTRVKDFEAFAKATGLKSTLWKDPGFRQGPDHPVVNVTWREATAFCKWLTVKEQKEGLITANQEYRLPTDLEWSKAAGLPEETGKTPEARDMGVPDVYPWGTAWPPPPNSGNYTGEETGSDVAIKGYDDGFAWTAPVGSFPPNKFGLFDMGGNVWQWCMDSWNGEGKAKVLRGGSWYNGALKLSLLSSCRVHAAPDSSTDNYGFRCVIASAESGKSLRK